MCHFGIGPFFSWANATVPVTSDRPSITLMIFFMG
jgi:hypothetical protein